MFLGGGDGAALAACYDELGSTVFRTCCHLTAGDVDDALGLLVETFRTTDSAARRAGGEDVGRTTLIDAAHLLVSRRPSAPGTDARAPLRGLPPEQLAMLSLCEMEERTAADVGALFGRDPSTVDVAVRAAREEVAPDGSGVAVADLFRDCEVWFDDSMRERARARLSGDGPAPTGASDGRRLFAPFAPFAHVDPDDVGDREPAEPPGMSRRAVIGAVAGASVLAGLGIAAWISGSDDTEDRPLDLPTVPTAEATATTQSSAVPPTDRSTTTATAGTDASSSDTAAPSETVTLDPATGAPATDDADATTTDPPRPLQVGFILDPVPPALQPDGGGTYSSEADIDWFQVWASPDAQHLAGRWLALLVTSVAFDTPYVQPGSTRREELAGRNALVRTWPGGIVSVTAELDETLAIETRSYGFTVQQLGELIAGTQATISAGPRFAPQADAQLYDMDLRISRSGSGYDILGELRFTDRSAYYRGAGPQSWVGIGAAPQQPDDLFALQLIADPVTTTAAPLAADGSYDIGGRRVVLCSFPDYLSRPMAAWHDGGMLVLVDSGREDDPDPIGTLVSIVAATRLATDAEWEAQRRTVVLAADGGGTSVSAGDADDGGSGRTEVGRATTEAGHEFVVLMRPSTELGRPAVHVWFTDRVAGDEGSAADAGAPGVTSSTTDTYIALDPAAPVTVMTSIDSTLLICAIESPRLITAMRVTIGRGDPVSVPLVRVDDAGLYGAAHAFSETGAFEVALVDAHGIVITDVAV